MDEATPRMTEEEWDAAIARATAAEASHDVQWMLTGCFAAKGNADRAKHLKESLIAARSRAA